MNINKYVGASVQLNKVKDKQKKIKWKKKERYLYRLFLAHKAKLSERIFFFRLSNSKRTHTIFKKLLKRLEDHYKNTKEEIDPTIYIDAHLRFFGPNCFANQLISQCSLALYKAYELKRYSKKVYQTDNDFEEQQKTLTQLVEVRNESEKKVLKQLKKSGLFSKAFIRSKNK